MFQNGSKSFKKLPQMCQSQFFGRQQLKKSSPIGDIPPTLATRMKACRQRPIAKAYILSCAPSAVFAFARLRRSIITAL